MHTLLSFFLQLSSVLRVACGAGFTFHAFSMCREGHGPGECRGTGPYSAFTPAPASASPLNVPPLFSQMETRGLDGDPQRVLQEVRIG
ncbi:hypothetical protein EV363DRAFT_584442 [Boletus edulis]|nr:hypothetical protein EV363DRAFT_584442 [Boletus edulis]